MSEVASLTKHQKAQLENIDCDTLARDTLTVEELRNELAKLKSDAEKEKACRAILSVTGTQTEKLMKELGTASSTPQKEEKKGEPKKPPESVTEESQLPLAPTTAFNIIRLVQLGYFPKDYAPLWGDKPSIFHKGVQMFYVLPGKLGEWARTKANTAFQKKYDRDAAYKDFMLDLTKQMNAELEDWFKQNKLSNKANIDAARQSLDAMRASFTAGNEKEAFTHFDTLTEKMGMRVNGKWHEKSPADLTTARAEQDTKTAGAEKRVDLRKQIQTRRVSVLEGQQSQLKAKKGDIDNLYREELPKGNTIDERFRADDIRPSDIDAEIKKLQLDKAVLENHPVALNAEPIVRDAVAGRSFADIEASRNDYGYSHPTKADIFLPPESRLGVKQNEISGINAEIEGYNKPNGLIMTATDELEKASATVKNLSEEKLRIEGLLHSSETKPESIPELQRKLIVIMGDPIGAPPTEGSLKGAEAEVNKLKGILSARNQEVYNKGVKLAKLEGEKKSLLTQSEQDKVAYDWFQKRMVSITQIDLKVNALNRLKPLIEARNIAARKLASTEKSIAGSAAAIAKREQIARDAHATASPIHDALDKLADPSISRSERLAMNDKLNELLAAKNPEAERIERLLKGTQAEKNQAIRELQGILDARGRGVDFFKSSLEGIEGKIKGLQGEAARIMTEYDRQAGTGDVEALRKKMEIEIGKINTEIERYNADARVKYGAAAATLTPVQMESLHLQTKLGGFFDLVNKGVIKAESVGSTPGAGKAMRGVYGVMTLAGLGQIGVTTASSGLKQGAIDAADMGIGFVPVVGGAYDILVGAGQFVKGSEITSDREVSKTDALKRMGFGVLGLIPIAGQAFKAAAKGEKLVEVARKVAVVERTAEVTGKVLILNEAKNLGVALYDATASVVADNGGPIKTAESVLKGRPFPINTQVSK